MAHIVTIDRHTRDRWQFEPELFALIDKVKGVTRERPVIVTVQVGETRWVANSGGILPK